MARIIAANASTLGYLGEFTYADLLSEYPASTLPSYVAVSVTDRGNALYRSDGTNYYPISSSAENYQINIKDRGARCDALYARGGGAITSGTTAFTDSGAAFTSSDVGKLFYIAGAGSGGLLLSTTIAAYVSATAVTLAAAASTTVSGAHYIYGTDDTTVWTSVISAMGDNAINTIIVPYGKFSLTDGLALKNNASIQGMQPDGWAFQSPKRVTGLLLKPQSSKPAMIYGVSSSVGNVQVNKILLDGAARFQGNTVCKYSGGAISSGSNTFTDSGANFTTADIGKKIAVYGAGAGGTLQDAAYVGTITARASATSITIDGASHPASRTVSNAAYSYGFSTQQGMDGVTTASSTTFTSATGAFTSSDVGRSIEIYGASLPTWGDGTINHGDGVGELLSCTIAAVLSSTSVTLSVAADISVSSAQWRIGVVHGIYQEHSSVSQDSMWHTQNVLVRYTSGSGYVIGQLQRAQRANMVYVWQTLGVGFHIHSSDNSFNQSMAAECGDDGIYCIQGTNHFWGIDTFNNNGNGVYLSEYAGMCTLNSISVDNNDKNGICDFAKGTMMVGVRYTSNSQSKNGEYADYTCHKRSVSGVSNINKPGKQKVACFWALGGNGNLPSHLLASIGPYGIRGTGVQYDPALTMFTVASVTSGGITTLHQTSFGVEGGATVYFKANNSFDCSAAGGLQIGKASTDYLGFFGATAVQKQNVTGAKGGNAALGSLLTALANLGFLTDNTSA